MGYTLVDLLDRFIAIEQAGYKMYMDLVQLDSLDIRIKTVARVFAIEEKRHIKIYQDLKEEMEKQSNIEVDFFIYDKASTLIYQFSKTSKIPDVSSIRSLLQFCLDFERDNLALLLSIKGLLVKSKADEKSPNYKALLKVIEEERKHIRSINEFLV